MQRILQNALRGFGGEAPEKIVQFRTLLNSGENGQHVTKKRCFYYENPYKNVMKFYIENPYVLYFI